VATAGDIADYFRLPPAEVIAALTAINAQQVSVAGWTEAAWLTDDAEAHAVIDEEAVCVVSPLDSLCWTRGRQQRLFGKNYLLEAYKPIGKREFGYFGMPVILGSRMVGRVAPRRKGSNVSIENLQIDEPYGDALETRVLAEVARVARATYITAKEAAIL
jgi:uncharacterized protein YcaQ